MANQKQELPVAAMFGWGVSEEKIKMWKVNGPDVAFGELKIMHKRCYSPNKTWPMTCDLDMICDDTHLKIKIHPRIEINGLHIFNMSANILKKVSKICIGNYERSWLHKAGIVN